MALKRARHSSRSVCEGCTCCAWVDACQCIQEHWDFSDYNIDSGFGYHCFCCYWHYRVPSGVQGVKRDFREPFAVLAADVLLASRRGVSSGGSVLYPHIALEAASKLDLDPTFFYGHQPVPKVSHLFCCKPPRGAPAPVCYCGRSSRKVVKL